MNFSTYLFHCSSLGKIMTDSRTKSEPLGETCKAHLLEIWIKEKYGREDDLENKYVEKGNMVEETSMTLYSRCTKTFFKKNTQTFHNHYIIGTPDIIHEGMIIDLKSSWSIWTFFANLHKPVNKNYLYQVNGYLKIVPDTTVGKLVYVLENTPDVLIEQEKSKLRYKMGIIDPDASPAYLEACEKIEFNSRFDDIPLKERYLEFTLPVIDFAPVYEKIELCREFLNKLG